MKNFGKEMKDGAICSAKIGACAFVFYTALTLASYVLKLGKSSEDGLEPDAKQSGEPLEGAAKQHSRDILTMKLIIMDNELKRERVTILTALVVLIVGFIWGISNKVLDNVEK